MTARWQNYDQEKLRTLGSKPIAVRYPNDKKCIPLIKTAYKLADAPSDWGHMEYFDLSELKDPVDPLGEPIDMGSWIHYDFKDGTRNDARIGIRKRDNMFIIRLLCIEGSPALTKPMQRHLVRILQTDVKQTNVKETGQ